MNGFAIQTFNFENEWLSWADDSLGQMSYDSSVSCLINGYHDCYTYHTEVDTVYSTVSLLLEDGGVKQFLSCDTGYTTEGGYLITGEYRSMTKDSREKGYVGTYTNGKHYFVLFQENGNKIYYDFYSPTWKTKITNIIDSRDSLYILLPKKFVDPYERSINISYIWGDTVYGRPLVASIGSHGFDWNFMSGVGQGLFDKRGLYKEDRYIDSIDFLLRRRIMYYPEYTAVMDITKLDRFGEIVFATEYTLNIKSLDAPVKIVSGLPFSFS